MARHPGKYFLGLLLVFGLVSFAFAENAVLLKKHGDVKVKRTDAAKFTSEINTGDRLAPGDTLRTGTEGFAALLYEDDKSMIKVRPNSLFSLVEETIVSEQVRKIRMKQGQVLLKVTGEKQVKYQLATATSVASVKGTEFWTLTDGNGNDRFVGVEGTVEIVNTVSGDTLELHENETVLSSPGGGMMTTPTLESDVPPDPYPEGMEEGQVPQQQQGPPSGPETPEETAPEGEGEGLFGVQTNASIGAATIGGQVYNQIRVQPEFSVWKLGIALDLAIYMDQDGNIREDDWDDFGDVIDKIYYIRYGQPGQPLYLRAGAIEDVTLGYGILVNQYSNAIEYPDVRRVGLQYEANFGKYSLTGFLNNFREYTTLDGPGLMGARLSYNPFWKLDVGVTYVMDGNQYLGLEDSDDDGYPDAVDKFPNNPNAVNDSDNDGIPDWFIDDYNSTDENPPIHDKDVNNNNYLDEGLTLRDVLTDTAGVDGVPFSIADRFFSHAAAVDVGAPIFNWKFLNMHLFSQFAQILPTGNEEAEDIKLLQNSWGATPLGMRMKIAFVQTQFEYRYFQKYFISDFYNRTYEIDRVTTGQDQAGNTAFYTKTERVLNKYDYSQQGFYGSASANLFDIVNMSASYQDMFAGENRLQSVYTSLGLNTSFIPKIKEAKGYIYKSNVDDLFVLRTPSTIMGYSVVYEISGGAALQVSFRETYRDLNGNGHIEDGGNEVVRSTNIETVFSF